MWYVWGREEAKVKNVVKKKIQNIILLMEIWRSWNGKDLNYEETLKDNTSRNVWITKTVYKLTREPNE